MTRRPTRSIACLLLLASGLAAGCDAGFIRDEAQQSLATFLTGVVTTAIDGALGAND